MHQYRAVLTFHERLSHVLRNLCNARNQCTRRITQSGVCEPQDGLNGAAGIPCRQLNDEGYNDCTQHHRDGKMDTVGAVYRLLFRSCQVLQLTHTFLCTVKYLQGSCFKGGAEKIRKKGDSWSASLGSPNKTTLNSLLQQNPGH